MMKRKNFPSKAGDDALHVAIATINKMDFIVSWNMKHIANPVTIRMMTNTILLLGFACPIICTPDQILGAFDE